MGNQEGLNDLSSLQERNITMKSMVGECREEVMEWLSVGENIWIW